MEKSLFNELTLEQKQKLLTLPAELKHFTQTQWGCNIRDRTYDTRTF